MSTFKTAPELYRHCLHVVRTFPVSIQAKIRTNIRELFEVNKTETNPETIQSLINQGEKDIESLQIMLTARMETLTMLIAESNLTRGTSVKQETNEH